MTNFSDAKNIIFRSGPFKALPSWFLPITGALVAYAVISHLILQNYPDADLRIRVDFDPLLLAPLTVQIHVVGAIITLFIGIFLMLAPKGFRLHRTFGWAWVISMAVTAGSSFFLTGLMGSIYSPIHALSAWVMIGLPFGIAAARRRDIKKHRKSMTDMFMGGMVIAGLFSFLPGRLMWTMFFAI